MAVTMRQIADLAGVSRPVVSAVLSQSSRTVGVSADRAEEIRRIAAELGYRKQWKSKVLSDGRTRLVGMIGTHRLHNAGLLHGLTDGFEPHGMALTLVQAAPGHHEMLLDGRFDGCLIDFLVQPEQLAAMRRVKLPGLIINAEPRGGVGAVRIDEAESVRLAVDHLLDLGHRRVGYLGLDPDTDVVRQWAGELVLRREAGWAGVCERRAGALRGEAVRLPSSVFPKPVEAFEASALPAMLRRAASRRPTAFITYNDRLALALTEWARTRGLRCPQDFSVVALEYSAVLEPLRPGLTAVEPDFYRVGRVCAERLLSLVEARQAPGPASRRRVSRPADILVPSPLVVRGSTGPPPG